MTRSLRSIHRKSFYLLAALVPTVFVLGIATRQPQLEEPIAPSHHLGSEDEVWPSGLLATRNVQASVVVTLLKPLNAPDPLLYCVSTDEPIKDLPPDAMLLGSIRDGAVLSRSCATGQLIFYSLGHHEILDQLPPKDRR